MNSDRLQLYETRQELLTLLGLASELEHALTCQYLYLAFSLKRRPDEGIDEVALEQVRGWCAGLLRVARQEMEHLALASNLMVALGGTPYLERRPFPYRRHPWPTHLHFELLPFSENALRHLIHCERPAEVEAQDVFSAEELACLVPTVNVLQAGLSEFESIGDIYQRIQDLIENCPDGEALLVGTRLRQIDNETIGLYSRGAHGMNVQSVVDRASALAIVDQIRTEGEGAFSADCASHFNTLLAMRDESRRMAPRGNPVRQVAVNPRIRITPGTTGCTHVCDPFTVRMMDLFNTAYEVMLLMLNRYFVAPDQTEQERSFYQRFAFLAMMSQILRPLGEVLTELPVGGHEPGLCAGPSFELSWMSHVAAHRESGWIVIRETLHALAERSQALYRERPELPRLEVLHQSLRRISNVAESEEGSGAC